MTKNEVFDNMVRREYAEKITLAMDELNRIGDIDKCLRDKSTRYYSLDISPTKSEFILGGNNLVKIIGGQKYAFREMEKGEPMPEEFKAGMRKMADERIMKNPGSKFNLVYWE